MTFKVEFDAGEVVEWTKTTDGATARRRSGFEPSLYVEAPGSARETLAAKLADDPKVVRTDEEQWFTSLRADERRPVLRVDVERVREVRTLARELRHHHERGTFGPGTFRLYNVDFAPQFRYCLATGTRPVPAEPLSTFSFRVGEKRLADRDVTTLELDGERVSGSERAVLETVHGRVQAADPDVLVFDDARLVPLLFERAEALGFDGFSLGRRPGYERLAGASTFESYGRVGHSPARYDLPGRVIVDESNSFLWAQTSLDGLLDLVAHSWKPLQETAWGSIGNILTAIQMREALARDVLVPWNKWEPEQFKDVRTLHAADRGGFTFAPEVGLHEDVVEVDFASLYPRIMVEYNVSPDTILCDCHADREDVPELGYNVCDERGFVADVLEPLLEQRAAFKARLRATDDPALAERLDRRSNALKWILVSCFGYQGYRNAKFGRIECHEAINAYARELLLQAKETFEAAGWEVVHGIVDSIWLRRRPGGSPAPIDELVADVSERVGIDLEFESEYEWLCFVPRRQSSAGALTKYFGKRDDGTFKVRGIESRQRSTPAFVADAQRAFMEVLDEHRAPGPVCEELRAWLSRLRRRQVDPADLVIRKRASKSRSEYSQRTATVAALQRAERHGVEKHPGQDVRYVVVDDGAGRTSERVRLPFEDVDDYDAAFYEDLLVRAAESVVSPLGWERDRIRRHLQEHVNGSLSAFGA